MSSPLWDPVAHHGSVYLNIVNVLVQNLKHWKKQLGSSDNWAEQDVMNVAVAYARSGPMVYKFLEAMNAELDLAEAKSVKRSRRAPRRRRTVYSK